MTTSVWCTTAYGLPPEHPKAHKVCAQRIRLGLLPPCDCPDHESPVQQGETSYHGVGVHPETGDMTKEAD